MTPRLLSELTRLYAAPDRPLPTATAQGSAPGLRALALGLTRPADWAVLAPLWRGVQHEWNWPAPGIAVGGDGHGLQLWFSLAPSVSLTEAHALLDRLQRRWLPDVARERLWCWPSADGPATPGLPPVLPPQRLGPEQWSAFVAPDLAAVFGDAPWLDLPPGEDAQADLLAKLGSVPAADLDRALRPAESAHAAEPAAPPAGPAPHPTARAFLTAVMNDPSVALALRIEAAKALL